MQFSIREDGMAKLNVCVCVTEWMYLIPPYIYHRIVLLCIFVYHPFAAQSRSACTDLQRSESKRQTANNFHGKRSLTSIIVVFFLSLYLLCCSACITVESKKSAQKSTIATKNTNTIVSFFLLKKRLLSAIE